MASNVRNVRRRRFNKKFVVWMLAVLAGGAIVGYGAQQIFFTHDVGWYVQAGDEAFKRGNFPEADKNYRTALGKSNAKELARVAYMDGLAMTQLAQDKPEAYHQDRLQWAKAVQMDPTYLPANEALLDAEIKDATVSPSPTYFQQLTSTCARILQTKPDHPRAKAYLHIAPIASWLLGVDSPAEEIDRNLAALMELMGVNPQDADIPFYIARVFVNRAVQESRQGSEEHARDLYKRAIDVFEKVALKNAPDNPAMHFHFYQILANCAPTALDPKELQRQMHEELDQACKLATDSEPLIDDIFIAAVQFEYRQRDLTKAEETCRQLLRLEPNDQLARLTLAQTLQFTNDVKKIDEAIDLMRRPIGDLKHYQTPLAPAELRRKIDVTTVVALDELLLIKYKLTTDAQEKQEVMKQIEDGYQRIADRSGLDYSVLKLRGKIDLLQGTSDAAINAIQEFEKAQRLYEQSNPGKADADLLELLAKSYIASHQTGTAKRYLDRIIKLQRDAGQDAYPDRIMLTQLLLSEGDLQGALDQIKILAPAYPGSPDVQRLTLVLYTLNNRTTGGKNEKVEVILAKLPQKTPQEKWSKAQLAMQMGKLDMATELLESLRAEKEHKEPSLIQVVDSLVVSYTANKKPEQALKVLADEIEKSDADSPERGEFALLQGQLKKEPPEKIEELTMASLSKIKDPVERELKIFEHLTSLGKPQAEVLPHLDAAEKADPENVSVINHRFELALQHKNWEEAENLAERLGTKNADESNGVISHFRVAMAMGDTSRALLIAQTLTKNLPEFSRSWQYLGQVVEARGDYPTALSDYLLALDKQTDNVDAYRGIVECCYAMNKPEEARQYLERGLVQSPNNQYLRDQLVQYYLNFGDPANAVEPRKSDLEAHPDSMPSWTRLAEVYSLVAQSRARAGKTEEAQQNLSAAQQTIAQAITRWPDEMVLYSYLAHLRMLGNDFAGGEKILLELEQRPSMKKRYEPREMLADFYARYGQGEKAKTAYAEALSLSGNSPEMQVKISQYYFQIGNFDDGLKVLDANSPDQRVQLQIVETLLSAHKLADAGKVIRTQLAKLQHPGPVAHPAPATLPMTSEQLESIYEALLGFVCMSEEKWDEATERLARALALDGKNARALFFRGRMETVHAPVDLNAAVSDIAAARDLDPNNSQYHSALAQIFRATRHIDEAIREMEIVVKLSPFNKAIRLELVQVYAECNPPRFLDAQKLLQDSVNSVQQWQKDPDFPHAAAVVAFRANNLEQAMQLFVEAIRLSPQKQWVMEYMQVLAKAKKFFDLLTTCNQLVQQPDWQKDSMLYRMRAVALSHTDHKDEAMADYDTAFNLAGESKDLETMDKVIEEMAENFGMTAAITRVQSKIEQRDPHWTIIGAFMYSQHGEALKAEQLIERVLATSSTLPATDLQMAEEVAGAIYMSAQEYAKARQIYERILVTEPNQTVALNNIADILCDHVAPPQPAKAREYSQKAIDILKNQGQTPSAALLDTHGWILVQLENLDDGILYLNQAINQKTDFLEARYHLGEALRKKLSYTEAINQFTAAQTIISSRQNLKQTVDAALVARIIGALNATREEQQKQLQGQAPGNPPANQ